MKYNNIKASKFIDRPNRFIANIEIDGRSEVCHVKNTGRCRELLTDNASIFVQESDNPLRKTKYDLISVYKGHRLINMDSQAPNKVFHEWLKKGYLFENIKLIKPEYKYDKSRIDFYVEAEDRKILMEVKGVTLEENNVVMFPDAPTERGLKHINELARCLDEGYEAYVVFIVQMSSVSYFTPNNITHKEFGDALKRAEQKGVKLLALDCVVTKDTIEAENYVDIKL
ncbi:MAG TPA: DNA/RNA nuclease SfsA [Clostridiales bacterium]|nr:DNA/RNA nuclease SfsA [Clostridiales bacterium]